MAKETLAEAQKRALDLQYQLDDASKRIAALTTDLTQANERADGEAKARQEAEQLVDERDAEIRQLGSSLRAYKGSATKARTEAGILKRELSPKARPIGAMNPPRGEEEAAERRAALEAAFQGPTEIVFSDGRREIRELAPLIVTGDAWLATPHHRELNADPILEPVACERQELTLGGFALLNEAGEQVGYCPLPTPIVIGRTQRMRMPRGSIRF